MASFDAANLFNVSGMVAVVTGGATGKSPTLPILTVLIVLPHHRPTSTHNNEG